MGKLRWDMVPSLLACLPACHPHNAYLQLLYLCICECVFAFILSFIDIISKAAINLRIFDKDNSDSRIKIHLILFHIGCWHGSRGGHRKIKIDEVGYGNIGDNDYDGGGGGDDEDDDGYWWWRSWAKPCWHESRRREGRVKNLNNGFDTTPVQGTMPIMVPIHTLQINIHRAITKFKYSTYALLSCAGIQMQNTIIVTAWTHGTMQMMAWRWTVHYRMHQMHRSNPNSSSGTLPGTRSHDAILFSAKGKVRLITLHPVCIEMLIISGTSLGSYQSLLKMRINLNEREKNTTLSFLCIDYGTVP